MNVFVVKSKEKNFIEAERQPLQVRPFAKYAIKNTVAFYFLKEKVNTFTLADIFKA